MERVLRNFLQQRAVAKHDLIRKREKQHDTE
jgi:hypothetical protein